MRSRVRAIVLAGVCAGSLHGAEPAGRYLAAPTSNTSAATVAPEVVEITPRRQAYAITRQPLAGGRKRRGWGLLDGDTLGVALSTGGSAYGVAIYQHLPGEHTWKGRWLTSLDGGASAGTIQFDDNAGLRGRHRLVCARPGAGTVSGTVEIKANGEAYELTFRLGRAVFYRGVGLPLPGEHLAVGWSFGSKPEVAAYQVTGSGALTGRRLTWNSGRDGAPVEALQPASEDQLIAATTASSGLYPVATRGGPLNAGVQMPLFAAPAAVPDTLPAKAADGPPGAELLTAQPESPNVKAWSYPALLRQYGQDGWAERWLQRQLTPEELHLLRAALRRHRATADVLQQRSIGTLLEEERKRSSPP